MPGLIDMRVFTGEPGNEYRETLASASEAAAAGGVTTMIVMPNTDPVIDDAAIVDFILRRARDTAIVRVAPMAAITKGTGGAIMTEIGLLKEAGAVAVTDGRRAVANAAGLRPLPRLCEGLRHAGRPARRGAEPGNRRHECRRDCDAARPAGHHRGRRSHHARARRSARRAHGRPLPRGADLVPGLARRRAPRQGRGTAGDLRRLGQPSGAQRERHRRLPNLLQDIAAAQGRGRPPGDGRGLEGRDHRRHRVEPRSAEPGHQAACRSSKRNSARSGSRR